MAKIGRFIGAPEGAASCDLDGEASTIALGLLTRDATSAAPRPRLRAGG